MVYVDNIYLLLTNYHVISGRHPRTGEQLSSDIPDRILIPVLRRYESELRWRPVVQRLDIEGQPAWCEHPRHGRHFDVVALPIEVPPDAVVVPYTKDPGPDLALPLSSSVAIIGFPRGMSASGITALWKTGAIASEPELLIEEEEFFYIDANTNEGMSGSPVIARRFGGVPMADGSFAMYSDSTVDRVLGVYAGRAFDAPDMTLGRVWKWRGVQEVIEAAVAKRHRGTLKSHPCLIGHYAQMEKTMVKIEVNRGVEIPAQTPSGTIENVKITLASIIRDTTLNDDRFGLNLERVKMAAAIAAALDAAQANGTVLELEDAQYALVREAIEFPTKPYNAAAARHILPLLDHVIEAGQTTSNTPQQ